MYTHTICFGQSFVTGTHNSSTSVWSIASMRGHWCPDKPLWLTILMGPVIDIVHWACKLLLEYFIREIFL